MTVKFALLMLPSRKNKQRVSKGERLRWPLAKDVKPVTMKSLDVKPIEVTPKAGEFVSGASREATLLIP